LHGYGRDLASGVIEARFRREKLRELNALQKAQANEWEVLKQVLL
jgi:hypothetical protein